jgi:hypothetical protein
MNPRLTGRTIAATAAVLALAGSGVAYAAGDDGTNTTQTQQQQGGTRSGTNRAGRPGEGPRELHFRGGPGGPGGFGLMLGPGGEGAGRAVADYLGLDARGLREQLAEGRSLADVARAQGKSVEGLQDAFVAAATTQLDRAVADGWLGAKARDEILSRLREHVADLVAATPPAPPRGARGERRFFRGGPGGHGCPAPPLGRDGRPAPPPAPDRSDRSGSDDEQGSSTEPGSWSGATVRGTWS